MADKLTVKQENFCQAYVRLGDKSAAYREAYDTSGMKPETVNENASRLSANSKVAARIANLQDETKKRNDVTIDEVVKTLASMLRFDIAELYDENGILKNIHSIPKEARLMIQELNSEELYTGGKDRDLLGFSKKVKTYSKTDAIEKLMRHLGGYDKDNEQRKPQITNVIKWGDNEVQI